jgi:putative acetyltransferase
VKIERAHEHDFPEIVEVWEASVRATHHFLQEEHIQLFKPLILKEYLKAVHLWCVRDEAQKILGFLGISQDSIEMLFIHPAARGMGIGRKLTQFAIEHAGVTKVDVNEQNDQAVGFYRHIGFKVVSRSATDGMGLPYPILHMEL